MGENMISAAVVDNSYEENLVSDIEREETAADFSLLFCCNTTLFLHESVANPCGSGYN